MNVPDDGITGACTSDPKWVVLISQLARVRLLTTSDKKEDMGAGAGVVTEFSAGRIWYWDELPVGERTHRLQNQWILRWFLNPCLILKAWPDASKNLASDDHEPCSSLWSVSHSFLGFWADEEQCTCHCSLLYPWGKMPSRVCWKRFPLCRLLESMVYGKWFSVV